MKRTFTHVVDRKPVLTARFNRYGQLIEIEAPDGRRASKPIQTFETTPLSNIDLNKVETFNVLVYKDADTEEQELYCIHWRCRLYCFPHTKPVTPRKQPRSGRASRSR